jgi:hypothetical protein
MPFDVMSDLVIAALCAAAMVSWIGRELAERTHLADRLRRRG